MKLITAVLRPECLEAIHDALDKNEACILSAAPAVDARFSKELYRGLEVRQPRPRLRLEVVVVNDLAVQDAINAIARALVETGGGDGSVLVTPADDFVRLPRALAPSESSDDRRPSLAGQATSLHRSAANPAPEAGPWDKNRR